MFKLNSLMTDVILILVCLVNMACSQQLNRFSNKNQTYISEKKDVESRVIYGDDNRVDYLDIVDPDIKEMMASTVALISNEHFIYDSVFDKFHLKNPEVSLKMCTTERFRHQPTWAFCSGSLIGPDLILTAGHCVRTQKECRQAKFVFDYTLSSQGTDLNEISAHSVYECDELVYSTDKKESADFAIVRLNRVVADRKILQFSEDELTKDDTIMLIGHPAGLPTKATLNGKIRSLDNNQFFKAELDAFTGNSGSSVFDQKSKRIIGVLARGEADYERENGCYISKVCKESECRGEDVTRISEIQKYLPKN